jgi:hypothetical protein
LWRQVLRDIHQRRHELLHRGDWRKLRALGTKVIACWHEEARAARYAAPHLEPRTPQREVWRRRTTRCV